MDERLYDIQEAMTFLHVSRATIYSLMRHGNLTGRRVGGLLRFYDSDLRAAVLTREIASPVTQQASPVQSRPVLPMKYG